jgi:type III secretion protein U
MQAPSQLYTADPTKAVSEMSWSMVCTLAQILLPLLAVVVVTGVAGNMLQVGILLAFESLKPDLNKINPLSKVKQIFSIKNLIELLKSIIKILFLGILIYLVIRNSLGPLLKIPFVGLKGLLEIVVPVLKTFAYNVCLAYVVVAFCDFIFQKQNHIKQLMMSKDEVKREYKESEGSPEIKGKRKQLHRELLQGGPVEKTKKSTVLVTNPTHYAVALFYDGKTAMLPVVLAKGVGFQAQLMRKAAQDFDVPIMENVPLAHALYDLGEVGRYIPRELIEPVAEVIRWVYAQKQKAEEETYMES